TGEFHAATDAAEALALWPADHRLRLTYRLLPRRLRLEAVVDNPDSVPLPFGLGYHPYFRVPQVPGEETAVEVPAQGFWELDTSLPTGVRQPVSSARDLTAPRPLRDLQLDDLLTDLDPSVQPHTGGLCRRGRIVAGAGV